MDALFFSFHIWQIKMGETLKGKPALSVVVWCSATTRIQLQCCLSEILQVCELRWRDEHNSYRIYSLISCFDRTQKPPTAVQLG